jgi:hypothetical protein
MPRSKGLHWVEKPEILSYIIDCYAGVEGSGGHRKRQFIWEEQNGDIVIGNARAFTDHVRERFGLRATPTSWAAVHKVLHDLGEVASPYSPRTHIRGGRFRNQEPEVRILKKAAARKEEKE